MPTPVENQEDMIQTPESIEKDKNKTNLSDFLKALQDPKKSGDNPQDLAKFQNNLQKWENSKTPEQLQKSVEDLRKAGVTEKDDADKYLKRPTRLARTFLKQDAQDPTTFQVNFQKNKLAEMKVGFADMVPPNVTRITILQPDGTWKEAVRAQNPATKRIGYFYDPPHANGQFEYAAVHTNECNKVKILQTHHISEKGDLKVLAEHIQVYQNGAMSDEASEKSEKTPVEHSLLIDHDFGKSYELIVENAKKGLTNLKRKLLGVSTSPTLANSNAESTNDKTSNIPETLDQPVFNENSVKYPKNMDIPDQSTFDAILKQQPALPGYKIFASRDRDLNNAIGQKATAILHDKNLKNYFDMCEFTGIDGRSYIGLNQPHRPDSSSIKYHSGVTVYVKKDGQAESNSNLLETNLRKRNDKISRSEQQSISNFESIPEKSRKLVEAAKASVGTNRFEKDFKENKDLKGGLVGCAWVASNLLKDVYGFEPVQSVDQVRAMILKRGWKKMPSGSPLVEGGIIIWENNIRPDGSVGHQHVGIITDSENRLAIDNSFRIKPPGPRELPIDRMHEGKGRGPRKYEIYVASEQGDIQSKNINSVVTKSQLKEETDIVKSATLEGQSYLKNLPNSEKIIEAVGKYDSYIVEACQKAKDELGVDVPKEIIYALIYQESSGNPNAVSGAGAVGLMQMVYNTALQNGFTKEEISKNPNAKDARKDPQRSIESGVMYFAKDLKFFNNNFKLALAAYNAGRTAVQRSIKQNTNGIPSNNETPAYVARITAMHDKLKDA